MNWQLWCVFVAAETALCFVPGPAVLLVLSQGLRHGTRKAVFSILGIVAANTAYFALSATGIGAVLMASYRVFFAIKWIGAAYLVWLGLSALFGRGSILPVSPSGDPRSNPGRLFTNGFILQMSNPKALLFFTALLPQFIDPHLTLWTQVLILAATSVVIEFSVQLLYATLGGRATSLVTQSRFARITDRVAGSALIAAGAGLAAIRR